MCRCLNDGIYFSIGQIEGITVGKTYTISGWVRVNTNSGIRNTNTGNPILRIYNEGDSSNVTQLEWTDYDSNGKYSDEYVWFSHTFTANSLSENIVFYYQWRNNTYKSVSPYVSCWCQFDINGLSVVEGNTASAWKAYGISLTSVSQTSGNLSAYVRKGEKVGGVLIDENGSTFEGYVKAD